jgi:hypothetical protein
MLMTDLAPLTAPHHRHRFLSADRVLMDFGCSAARAILYLLTAPFRR